MKLALALMLALSTGASVSNAVAAPSSAHAAPFDGVNPPARRAKRRKRPARRASSAGNKSRVSKRAATALVSVTEIDGEGLRKLLQRGEAQAARPLLVNFWATWCVPCRKEFPDLVRIGAEFDGRGLEFVTISADDVEELKTGVPKFLREMRATQMPAYLLNASDTAAAIAQVDPAWGGELPATFLFDRSGKLVFKHTGIINAAELRAEIEKALAGDK